ncbi:MAG: undecaprenyldiphospho-muramoylpentapeptide beta-N-acetylglucosaminyltransferase [Erysipelothrix sp.]
MKVCIVTGGSGGHIYPALTYADYISKNRGDEVVFIGNDYKMESKIIPEAGYAFYGIHNMGLQGSVIAKFKAVFSQFKAYRVARSHLKEIKPDVVVAFGGYVSAPVSLAASKLNIPLVLHEQNAFPGKANKMVADRASVIITCYKEAFSDMKTVQYLGNPRASLIHETIDSDPEWKRLGLKDDLKTVLMVMGSQGSSSMNEKFLKYIENFEFTDYQVVIVVGPTNYEGFVKRMGTPDEHVHVVDFVDQKALLPRIDLIVCRSGASTIAEIESFGLTSLLIPSPHVANNHQFYNAKSLYDVKACEMIEEANIASTTLNEVVTSLLADEEKRKQIGFNVKKLAMPNAVSDIADCIEKVVDSYGSSKD